MTNRSLIPEDFHGNDAIVIYRVSPEKFPKGKYEFSFHRDYSRNPDEVLDRIIQAQEMGDSEVYVLHHVNDGAIAPVSDYLEGLEGKSVELTSRNIPLRTIFQPKPEVAV